MPHMLDALNRSFTMQHAADAIYLTSVGMRTHYFY